MPSRSPWPEWKPQDSSGGRAQGATLVQFRQGFRSMAAPTRELEKLIVSRKLAHGANPVTRWMASNVAVAQEPAGNLKPAKDKSIGRIDGIIALIMLSIRAIVAKEQSWIRQSPYGCEHFSRAGDAGLAVRQPRRWSLRRE